MRVAAADEHDSHRGAIFANSLGASVPQVALVLFAVYVGVVEGYLKLKTQSDAVAAIRDVLLLGIVLAAARPLLARRRLPLPPLTSWVIAWVVVVLVQLANPANGGWGDTLLATRPHLEFVALFFLGFAYLRTPRALTVFFVVLAGIGVMNGVASVVQTQLAPEELARWGPGYAERINGAVTAPRVFVDEDGVERVRPMALGVDMGFGGAVGIVALPGCLALFGLVARRWWPLVAVGVAGTGVAVALSASRLAVLGSAAGVVAMLVLLAIAVRRTTRVPLYGLAAVAGLAIAVTFLPTPGVLHRYESIRPDDAISTAYSHRKDTIALVPGYARDFRFGAGLGSVGPGSTVRDEGPPGGDYLNAESEFTFLIVELGVPGLVVMLGLFLTLLLALTRITRIPVAARITVAGAAAPLVAIFLAWFVGPVTASPPLAPYFWMAAGTLAYWLFPRQGRREALPGTT